MTAKTRFIKEKLDKLVFIKMHNFGTSKDIIKNMKRQTTAWEKILANHISNQGLVSEIQKQIPKTHEDKQPN